MIVMDEWFLEVLPGGASTEPASCASWSQVTYWCCQSEEML